MDVNWKQQHVNINTQLRYDDAHISAVTIRAFALHPSLQLDADHGTFQSHCCQAVRTFLCKPPKHPSLRRSWSHPDPRVIRILITPQRAAQAQHFQSTLWAGSKLPPGGLAYFLAQCRPRSQPSPLPHMTELSSGEDVKFIKPQHFHEKSLFYFLWNHKQKIGSRWRDWLPTANTLPDLCFMTEAKVQTPVDGWIRSFQSFCPHTTKVFLNRSHKDHRKSIETSDFSIIYFFLVNYFSL